MRVLVGQAAAFLEGSQTAVEVDGKSVVVVNYEGQFYALRNNCSYQMLSAIKPVAVYQTSMDVGARTLRLTALRVRAQYNNQRGDMFSGMLHVLRNMLCSL